MAQKERKPGMYAIFETNQGTIVCELYDKQAPQTVKNFVDLAEGNKEYKDAKTGAMKKSRYYDGTTFHRVIPQFMIQGGDPTATGTGGPGYKFNDETTPDLKFDKPGRLAMANSGPNTNGSQFFIMEVGGAAYSQQMDGKYSIFGQVLEGADVVKKIARVPRNPSDKPNEPVVLQKLTIERVPQKAAGM
ncbi:MAG: peptidylprolyl isomerase [Acidobacteria bacterium RIFCSPLOWO2_12_FULL_54_10]|nr:MAG: peptidylprolyl isomerase [Acidobacteria bacterium RIFCSPLOWO2_12_FULL_54_10]